MDDVPLDENEKSRRIQALDQANNNTMGRDGENTAAALMQTPQQGPSVLPQNATASVQNVNTSESSVIGTAIAAPDPAVPVATSTLVASVEEVLRAQMEAAQRQIHVKQGSATGSQKVNHTQNTLRDNRIPDLSTYSASSLSKPHSAETPVDTNARGQDWLSRNSTSSTAKSTLVPPTPAAPTSENESLSFIMSTPLVTSSTSEMATTNKAMDDTLPVVTSSATTFVDSRLSHKKGNKKNPINKKRRKGEGLSNVKAKRTKRRNSTNTTTNSTAKYVLLDEAPQRLVNPLLDVIPMSHEPVNGAELLVPAELVYHVPDTFPLSYHARLLGFSVPPPPVDCDIPFPTPLPDIESLQFCSDENDPFLKIPSEGSSSRWRKKQVAREGDSDDRQTLDYMDPVYHSLLTKGFSSDGLKPAPSTLASRFAAQQQDSRTERVVKMGQKLLGTDLEGWTFQDWSSFSTEKSRNLQWIIDGRRIFSNPTPFGIVASYKGVPIGILRYQFQWYQLQLQHSEKRESELVMVIEGISQFHTAERESDATKSSEDSNIQTEAKASAQASEACDPKSEQTSKEEDSGMEVDVQLAPTDNIEAEAHNGNKDIVYASALKGSKEKVLADIEMKKSSLSSVIGTEGQLEPENKNDGNETDEAPTSKCAGSVDLHLENTPKSVLKQHASGEALKEKGSSNDNREISTQDVGTAFTRQGTTASQSACLEDAPNSVLLLMTALALEHTRACDVWYCLVEAPSGAVEIYETYFRMAKLPRHSGQSGVPMICDLKKCSSRYAFLRMKEGDMAEAELHEFSRERVLVRLPTIDEATAYVKSRPVDTTQRPKRTSTRVSGRIFTGAPDRMKHIAFGVRVKLSAEAEQLPEIHNVNEDGSEGSRLVMPQEYRSAPQIEILRQFSVPKESTEELESPTNWILTELKKKQTELVSLEDSLKPKLRTLLAKVRDERMAHHRPQNVKKRSEEKRLLRENEKIVARRKEMDEAWQKQLEQDMDAVCNICNDGEVTPDNQIIFCEACNVAVHQLCYGVVEVPDGDYYCTACRHFERGNMNQALTRKTKRDVSAPRITPPPLPICCELCPLKQGAFIRTETANYKPNDRNKTLAKWVHMVCAKWQGLQFVLKNNPEVVEDVTPLKKFFRKAKAKCDICQGQRGAYNQCRFEGCQKWLHITCARASGQCEVIHGEDVNGNVSVNPWSLMCPEHSDVNQEDLPRDPVPVEQLVRAAKEFPAERPPSPPPVAPKPFHKMTGRERTKWLAQQDFEQEFLAELANKKLTGVRCEVCDIPEDDGKSLMRCSKCSVVVCVSCIPDCEDPEQKVMKCPGCKYVEDKQREDGDFVRPQCNQCYQKGGYLLPSYANPVNRQSYWKTKQKQFAKTLFAKKMWCHAVCGFWNRDLVMTDGAIDCSNVTMSNGKGFVLAKKRCGLCGLRGGLKVRCSEDSCRTRSDRRVSSYFHATCARQAGLELQHDDALEQEFYVKCYCHGGREFNLRASLEVLIEKERGRAGKRLGQAETAMSLSHASRLLNQAILIVRILGWSWRWAELWVSHGSSWTPQKESGQKEGDVTRERSKIVKSTAESRCADARKCRLAAFGAALRNRMYDKEDGFDNASLDRALRAILNIPSIAGPLEKYEIDFAADWLGRAYRSRSRLLGLGPEKHEVANDLFCIHVDDKTPKFELGQRPLPGHRVLPPDQLFEPAVEESDDFLKPETIEDGQPFPTQKDGNSKMSSIDWELLIDIAPSSEKTAAVLEMAPSAVRNRRGRPPRDRSRTDNQSPENKDQRSGMDGSEDIKLSGTIDRERQTSPSSGTGSVEGSLGAEKGDKNSTPPMLEAILTNEGIGSGGDEVPKKKRRGRAPKAKKVSVRVYVGESTATNSPEDYKASRLSKEEQEPAEVECTRGKNVQRDSANDNFDEKSRKSENGSDLLYPGSVQSTEGSSTIDKDSSDGDGASQNMKVAQVGDDGCPDGTTAVSHGPYAKREILSEASVDVDSLKQGGKLRSIPTRDDLEDATSEPTRICKTESKMKKGAKGNKLEQSAASEEIDTGKSRIGPADAIDSAKTKEADTSSETAQADSTVRRLGSKKADEVEPVSEASEPDRSNHGLATSEADELDQGSDQQAGEKVQSSPNNIDKIEKRHEMKYADKWRSGKDVQRSHKSSLAVTETVDEDPAKPNVPTSDKADSSDKSSGKRLAQDEESDSPRAANNQAKRRRKSGRKSSTTPQVDLPSRRRPARRAIMGVTENHDMEKSSSDKDEIDSANVASSRVRSRKQDVEMDNENEEDDDGDDNDDDDDEDFDPEGADGSDESKLSESGETSRTKPVLTRTKKGANKRNSSRRGESSDPDYRSHESVAGSSTPSTRRRSSRFSEGSADTGMIASSRRSTRKRVKRRINLDDDEEGSDPEDSIPLSMLIASTRCANETKKASDSEES